MVLYDTQQPIKVFKVSEISRLIKHALEGQFDFVAVEGEVVEMSKPSQKGYVYFKLTEEEPFSGNKVRLECIVFPTSDAMKKLFSLKIEDGSKIIALGRITTYSARSTYQLKVEDLRVVGLGDLLLKLEALKKKLQAEGIFDRSRKKPIPFIPRKVGIVTSLDGAALTDMLRSILKRFPAHVIVVPSLVQGEGAAQQIARGISILNTLSGVDVIVIGRGGGSLEDLWAFNEEYLVRVVSASRVPVVSAVGHEIDHCLSDDAADVRAATPTAVGEVIFRASMGELLQRLDELETRLLDSAESLFFNLEQELSRLEALLRVHSKSLFHQSEKRLDHLERRLYLASPQNRLLRFEDRLNALSGRISRAVVGYLGAIEVKLDNLSLRLHARNPKERIQREAKALADLAVRLKVGIARSLERREAFIQNIASMLSGLDPKKPLSRGFALCRRQDNLKVITDSQMVDVRDKVLVELGKGSLVTEVLSKT
jgi:exodeoxyribonuclease VII large subunit